MQIFLDTANIDQIKQAHELGIISGVTTNPSLLSKEATADYESVTRKICAIVSGPVSVEVLSEDAAAMIAEARVKASWAPNVNIKIPITAEGLKATRVLSAENIKVNMTLCFSPNQALLGALAGATYVSIFIGRLDDAGHDGMQVVEDIIGILDNYPELDTRVIAASIRNPLHFTYSAMAGADIATVPYNVLMQMIQHPLTDIGIKRFLADWKSVAKK
ncbi:MAG TPA: fructose-6-phosphate aldolase [Dehalococcoidales bacterium]|nr:MAG: fructose-6-phosphate aldolase [Chloroflexi bacterium RBG_16_60_22]HJX12532.1 fructose-6-phosphate aldolase [Dehalococcoidales bacterium]